MMKKKNRSEECSVVTAQAAQPTDWEMFVRVVVAHVDPVLASMLYATEFLDVDHAQKIVRVATLKKFVLFQDLFIEQKKNYQEYLDRIFGFGTTLVVEFVNTAAPAQKVVQPVTSQSATLQQTSKPVVAEVKKELKINRTSAEFADTKKWKITNALLESFGGSVREIIKDKHEFDA